MKEIRIINGLKQGVSIPIDEDWISVGRDEDAELMIIDRVFGDNQFYVKLDTCKETVTVKTYGDALRTKRFITHKNIVKLPLSAPFNFSGVWFVIEDSNASWPNEVPSLERPKPASILSTAYFFYLLEKLAFKSGPSNTTSSVKWLNSASIVFTIIIATNAYDSFFSKQPEKTQEASLNSETSVISEATSSEPEMNMSTQKTRVVEMIAEREIMGVDVNISENSIVLTGKILKSHFEKLNRMALRLDEEVKVNGFIKNQTTTYENKAPFNILSIVSGPYGHIVIEKHGKIHIGEKYNGYKLLSITPNLIKLDGERRLDISW